MVFAAGKGAWNMKRLTLARGVKVMVLLCFVGTVVLMNWPGPPDEMPALRRTVLGACFCVVSVALFVWSAQELVARFRAGVVVLQEMRVDGTWRQEPIAASQSRGRFLWHGVAKPLVRLLFSIVLLGFGVYLLLT
jgi:hypothetical protein